jgi:hypothetical protein
MIDELHHLQMMTKPVLALDRMRGHLAVSDGTEIKPETAEAIRLVDKAYWLLMHDRDAVRANRGRKGGKRGYRK